MAYREEREGACVILTLDDAADVADVARLSAHVARLLDGGVRALVWDLEGLDLLSSTFVGLLLHARRKLHAHGGHMVLVGVGRRAGATFKTFGVDDVLTRAPTREAAIERALGLDPTEPAE